MLGLFVFGIAVVVYPGISAAAIAPRWALAAAVLPIFLLAKKIRLTPAHWIGLAFMGWACLSLLWTPVFYDGANRLIQYTIVAVAFCIGAETRNMRPVYIGAGLGIAVSAFIAAFQAFGIEPIENVRVVGPAGLFGNKNLMGEAAAMVAALTFASGLWVLLIPVLIALAISGCKGAILGAGCSFTLWLWKRSKAWGVGSFIVLVIAGSVAAAIHLGDNSLSIRSLIWSDTWAGVDWLGRGVGSYHALANEFGQGQIGLHLRAWHAHNDLLEILFELGPIGALLAAGFVGWLSRTPAEPEWLAVVAFCVAGLFGFPLFSPFTAVLFGLCTGHAAYRRHHVWLGMDFGRVSDCSVKPNTSSTRFQPARLSHGNAHFSIGF